MSDKCQFYLYISIVHFVFSLLSFRCGQKSLKTITFIQSGAILDVKKKYLYINSCCRSTDIRLGWPTFHEKYSSERSYAALHYIFNEYGTFGVRSNIVISIVQRNKYILLHDCLGCNQIPIFSI